jgi:hypothetical protein
MDNSICVNNVIIINELNELLEKIKVLIIEKTRYNNDIDEKLKNLYKEYQICSKKLNL